MNDYEANAVYDVLVEECGAPESMRDHFIYQTNGVVREWRFSGNLGFGGKFWRSSGRWYVNNYNEDRTPERDAMIEAADKRLAELKGNDGLRQRC